MYIWVLLATFLAMLYSYNLSHRADIREIEVEPVAKALISKLIIKQQAAGRYMRGNTPPFAQSSDAEGNIYKSDNITYAAGIISENELKGYLPYGFKDDGSVTTEIYCLDKENTSRTMACSEEQAVRYLVAYTVIPQRWLNVKTGLPNNDFNNAMKQIIGYDNSFGYPSCQEFEIDPTTEMKTCKKLAVRGREGLHKVEYNEGSASVGDNIGFEIPQYIAENGNFSTVCGNKKSGSSLCLIYIYEYKFKYYS